MAKAFVVDVDKGELRLVDCTGLEDYYRELGCDLFDIERRRIGDRYFDIYCDDMGLFRENIIISALNRKYEPMLFGNLVITQTDGCGETIDLTDDEVELIKENIRYTADVKARHVWPVVVCEY